MLTANPWTVSLSVGFIGRVCWQTTFDRFRSKSEFGTRARWSEIGRHAVGTNPTQRGAPVSRLTPLLGIQSNGSLVLRYRRTKAPQNSGEPTPKAEEGCDLAAISH